MSRPFRLPLLAATTVAAGALLGAGPPPRLDLTLKPHPGAGGQDGWVGVSMRMQAPALKAGDGLVHLPLRLVGIPTARYDGDALTARDDAGPLPLAQSEEPPTPQGVYRRWSATRASVGDVVVSYRAPPRKITPLTNNGPLFDLREEAGGFLGAGVGFVAAPVASGPYRVRLHWDLADEPAGSRGVWSLGDGDVETTAPAEVLAFSYYAAGPLKRYPAQASRFGVYWLKEPPFDMTAFSQKIAALYAYMAEFFGETGGDYRVFARWNAYRGMGGTALAHSFMFGWNPDLHPTVESVQGLVSHEMAHTWPALQGEHGETAWYSEGTAEYYSTLLAYRAGALTTAAFLKEVNRRADAYYTNPYRALSNTEAAKRFWSDPVAQTVPYARGFLYLAHTDEEIRAASGGKRSLDDVVKAIRRRQVAKQPYGVPEWLQLVSAEIGAERAKREYEAMAAGADSGLARARFAPCFTVEAKETRPVQLGFARASLNEDRVIRGVEPGSNAAAAGVRDGDVIVDGPDPNRFREDTPSRVEFKLRRDGRELTVAYDPHGAPVHGWTWARDAKVADAACRF